MKKIILLSVSVVLLLGIAAHIILPSKATMATAEKKKPIYCVETSENKIAISFDAAWGADNTQRIMDILEAYKVNATFFLVGFWVDKYPEMVKEIDARGFEIGNHSENHPQMSKLSCEQMRAEILSVNEKIKAITQKTPTVFRPPYGDYCDGLIDTLNSEKMYCIQWSIDSLDWKEFGRQELVKRVLKNIKAGDIILFHNNAKYTPEALPEILESILSQGFSVCSVGELIHKEGYFVDNLGIQHLA